MQFATAVDLGLGGLSLIILCPAELPNDDLSEIFRTSANQGLTSILHQKRQRAHDIPYVIFSPGLAHIPGWLRITVSDYCFLSLISFQRVIV